MSKTAIGGARSVPLHARSEPGPGRPRWRRPLLVAGLALAVFAVGSIGLFTAVRDDAPPPPPESLRRAQPVLASSPVIDAGTLADLIGELQARLREFPDDWRAFASLGMAYVQQARVAGDPSFYPKAEEALRRSLELEPDENVGAVLGMGALSLARHEFDQALFWGERAVDLAPFDASALGVTGDAQVELGRYEDAFATFQHMVDLRPSLASYARASYARELQGDVAGALEIMGLAAGAASQPIDEAWARHLMGDLAFNAGRLDEAEAHYRRAAARAPSYLPAQAGLANVAAARGRVPEAIEGYETVVATSPLPEHVAALAELYVAAGREEDAGRQVELLEAERRLLEANGVSADLEFALFSADHGIDLEAGLAAAEAEWARRESVHVADALAWQLHAHGRDREALGFADRALALGTRSASFHFHRGLIHRALGDDAAAVADLSAALDINPAFSVRWAPVAREALAELGAAR